MASLEGKTAIVTGASSGIGAATVAALRAEGARVAGGARRAERIDADAAIELDVTDPASCERFVDRAVEELGGGGLDVVVNAAGLALGRDPFDESTEDDDTAMYETLARIAPTAADRATITQVQHDEETHSRLASGVSSGPGAVSSPQQQLDTILHRESWHRHGGGWIGQAIYGARKSTVEPVLGIIQEVLGFRQFSLRGQVAAAGEWVLVCLAYNLKRFHRLTVG